MITHGFETPWMPRRVVVLGAGGFIGGAILRRLGALGIPALGLGRGEADLEAPDGAAQLTRLLRRSDSVVAAAAAAPVKSPDMLVRNIRMTEALTAALKAQPAAHVVNISSDAVYLDCAEPLTEQSPAAPTSLHGVMHLTREVMLADAVGDAPLAHLRPTLVYGAGDPHNGYGPNKFRREAAAGGPIRLFGHGEERRDHIHICDVAELAMRLLMRQSSGVLNAATGRVARFSAVAEITAEIAGGAAIESLPRRGPMPHNGYRAFDVAERRRAFPDFEPVELEDGLRGAYAVEAATGREVA